MNSKKLIKTMSIVVFLTTGQSSKSFAAPLPLSQAVAEALSQNPSLQKAESALEEARWKQVEALSGFLPSVSASAIHLLDKKLAYIDVNLGGGPLSIPQIIPSTSYNLDAKLPIFDGLANYNRYRAAGDVVTAGSLTYEWSRFEIEHQVILLYHEALAAKQIEEVARQNVRTLEDHLKDVQLFKKAGVSTNYDVLRVEVQVSEARSALLDAIDNVAVAKQRLAEVMGRISEDRELEGVLPALKSDLVSKLKDKSNQDRFDLQSLRSKVNAYDKLESAAGVHLLPRIFLFGSYQRYNNLDGNLWSNSTFRNAYQAGIGLSWNIFDGMSSIARSKQSIEQRVQAEKTLEAAEIRSHEDQELWRRKFLYFCSVYNSRQNDVDKAKESVRLAREGRRVGSRPNSELLDAEADLNRAQAGSVNAQLGAIEALLRLELALGHRIYHFF